MKLLVPLVIFATPVFSLFSKDGDVTYKSYQNKIECRSKTPIQVPKSITEIQDIVKNATNTNTKVKVVGSRHSITDTICTTGIPIHLDNFKQVKINADKKTATIGAGIELIDALNSLHEQGYTIQHIPAYGGITVGGAIGLGAHGSSLRHRNTLSEYVVGFTVIDGQGELRKVADEEELKSFRVNFGLLGVVVDVTLEIVPQFKMEMENYKVSEDFLLRNSSQLIDLARQQDWFQFWWFPSSSGLVVSKGKQIDDVTTKGDARTNLIPNISPHVVGAAKLSFEALQITSNNYLAMSAIQKASEDSLHKKVLIKEPIFSDNGNFVNPAVGYGYRLMTNKCSPCAWESPIDSNFAVLPDESSVALPLSAFPAVVADIKQLIKENPTAFPLVGLFFRFSRPSRGLFALAHDRESFHIDWSYPMRLDYIHQAPYGLPVMQALVQLLVEKHNGRPHWGKNGLHFFNHALLAKRYPAESFAEFKTAVQKYDPHRVFSNRFGDRILGIDVEVNDIPEKVTHCALQDYCICQKNSDCSLKQTCSKIMDYPVCRPIINIL
ncbi:hypothetical protein BJ944DRAFT_239008 [Cunninghamella echinulata]|nr:hypothetical protein BJ944DRAFT_239008 [Cunninghamella echinulata]